MNILPLSNLSIWPVTNYHKIPHRNRNPPNKNVIEKHRYMQDWKIKRINFATRSLNELLQFFVSHNNDHARRKCPPLILKQCWTSPPKYFKDNSYIGQSFKIWSCFVSAITLECKKQDLTVGQWFSLQLLLFRVHILFEWTNRAHFKNDIFKHNSKILKHLEFLNCIKYLHDGGEEGRLR